MKLALLNQLNTDAFDLLKPTVVNCGSALSFAICVQRPTDGFTITGCKVRVTNADAVDLTLDATLSGSDYVVTFPASHFERYGCIENGVAISVLGADENGVERVWIERLGSLYIRPTDAQSEAGDPGIIARYPFVDVAIDHGVVSLQPFANNQLDLTNSDETAFGTSIETSPVEGAMRDLWFVVVTGATAPTITWSAYIDRFAGGSAAAVAPKANTANIYRITEYEAGHFELSLQGIFEDKSNKVTEFSDPTNTQYPSAKLVADQLALKSAPYPFVNAIFGSIGDVVEFTLIPFANNRADFTTPLYSGITAFTVLVSIAPVADTMRDLWFVVKSGATAPSITWPSGFEPANDDDDNLVAEASATTVFLISEYAPNKFLVARQVVEAAS